MRDNRDVTLSEALLDYYEQRSASYSKSTWRAHEGQLEAMRTWLARELGPNVLLTDVDERTMVRYFNRLRPPVLAASSFNNYRQYCDMFWSFCREEGWITRNPMRHVDRARIQRKVRLQLSAEELQQCLAGASPRDRIALAVGMNTGLRAGDLMGLKVGSVNLTNNLLTAWIEKTDTEQVIPITAELRTELLRWLAHYAEETGHTVESLPNEWTLIPPMKFEGANPRRPELGGKTVYKTDKKYRHPEQIVHRALVRLGHPTHQEGFHTLRRSAARVLFDLAADDGVGDAIRMPQTLLGHKNRQTTELYLGITHEKRMLDEMMRGRSFLTRAAGQTMAGNERSVPVSAEGGRRVV